MFEGQEREPGLNHWLKRLLGRCLNGGNHQADFVSHAIVAEDEVAVHGEKKRGSLTPDDEQG
jgi:hypothetical protein